MKFSHICRRSRQKNSLFRAMRRGILSFLLVALVVILLDVAIHPVLREITCAQLQNKVSVVISSTVSDMMSENGVAYGDFVTSEKDDSGAITALNSNMASVNQLRNELILTLRDAVGEMDIHALEIPLGNLVGMDMLAGRGPRIAVRALWIGTVTAEFESEFTAAGINQTKHAIYVNVSVPISVLLPSGMVHTQVDSRVCVAESILVGQVPDTYLQIGTE